MINNRSYLFKDNINPNLNGIRVLASNLIKGLQLVNDEGLTKPQSSIRNIRRHPSSSRNDVIDQWKSRHENANAAARVGHQENSWYHPRIHNRQNEDHGQAKLASDLAGAILNILGNNK